MAANMDPFFENHPEVVAQRKQDSEFFQKLREEAAANEREARLQATGAEIWSDIKDLEGEALDQRLRELGFYPDELLASFNKAMGA